MHTLSAYPRALVGCFRHCHNPKIDVARHPVLFLQSGWCRGSWYAMHAPARSGKGRVLESGATPRLDPRVHEMTSDVAEAV